MYQGVFKRVEKKYILSDRQFERLTKLLEGRFIQDQYGRHTIVNLYYDTDDFTLIRRSIEKPVYKEKLRLRSYGVPGENELVFAELKKKYKGVVYKRRVGLPLCEAREWFAGGKAPGRAPQIESEIDWFSDFYKPGAKAVIAYERDAFFCAENPEIRITFDRDIRWRKSALDLSKGAWGNPLQDKGELLMEIKIPDAAPVWLSRALSETGVFPTPYSKYGMCYKYHLNHLNNYEVKDYA